MLFIEFPNETFAYGRKGVERTVDLPKNTGLIDLVPSEFYLSQNYPNPFSERTTIKFCVAQKTKVKLEVFDSEGHLVKALFDEVKEAGTYEVEFAAPVGRAHAIGNPAERVYLCRFEAGDYRSERRMLETPSHLAEFSGAC